MNISAQQETLEKCQADTLVVPLFENDPMEGTTGALDRTLAGMIAELVAQGDIKGELTETTVLYPRDALQAKRLILVGMGAAEALDTEGLRKASAASLRRARALGAEHVATTVHSVSGDLEPAAAAQAVAEGALLALYRFDAQKQDKPDNAVVSLTLLEPDETKLEAVQTGIAVAEAVAAGVYIARDLVNMPPNVATPSKLAEVATELAEAHGFGLTVGDRAWAQERDMGAFLAVAKGAGEDPKFIVLEHNADREDLEALVLVGKGVTFDTGGITLKPGAGMPSMKSDLGGGAAVLGAMKAVGALNLPLRVIGIVPATENMPDANAYHPADVIRASNGKTIEIISTDAEGRMILADALVYAARYAPALVVDLATLTGSSIIALGKGVAAGLFSNDDVLKDDLMAAGSGVNERVWPLPLYEDYRKTINSDVADIKNTGGRQGGVGTSAVFLQEFTSYPWAHLDIAGMALGGKRKGYTTKGGTGFGVRLLVEFLRTRT